MESVSSDLKIKQVAEHLLLTLVSQGRTVDVDWCYKIAHRYVQVGIAGGGSDLFLTSNPNISYHG